MKIPHFFTLLTLVTLFTTSGIAAAIIEGRVELPKQRSIKVINKRYEIISRGEVMTVSPPLAVVYLEGEFPALAHDHVVQLVQKDLRFSPALLPVQVGTRVEFPNQDDTYHNIFSYSAPNRFDLGRYRSDERPIPSQIFEKPGLVTVRCDIHDHMRALILVLATPHFCVTDSEGRFRLDDIPPGRYIIKVWLNSKTTKEKTIEITDDNPVQVDFL